jgi:hypothetical protein
VECDKFQDAAKFLATRTERSASCISYPGSYRINTFLFEVQLAPVTVIEKEQVGIVTTLDGEPLDTDQIAGPVSSDHKNYQDPVKFLSGGGQKGRQEDVILAGAYYLNPWFAVVEQVPMLHIPIGNVGVVNSFVGVPVKTLAELNLHTAILYKKDSVVFGMFRSIRANTRSILIRTP